jgi:hypothetical protein
MQCLLTQIFSFYNFDSLDSNDLPNFLSLAITKMVTGSLINPNANQRFSNLKV